MYYKDLSYKIIGCAFEVHTGLGPGLLESAYELCLSKELQDQGLSVERQVSLPIIYKGIKLENGYRMDLVVNKAVVIEIKSVEALQGIHKAQLISYLRLSGHKLGFLINFNVQNLQKGIQRYVL